MIDKMEQVIRLEAEDLCGQDGCWSACVHCAHLREYGWEMAAMALEEQAKEVRGSVEPGLSSPYTIKVVERVAASLDASAAKMREKAAGEMS